MLTGTTCTKFDAADLRFQYTHAWADVMHRIWHGMYCHYIGRWRIHRVWHRTIGSFLILLYPLFLSAVFLYLSSSIARPPFFQSLSTNDRGKSVVLVLVLLLLQTNKRRGD